MRKQLIFRMSLTIVFIFLLSAIWEFWMEEWVKFSIFSESESKSLRERWEYILTSVSFATLALIYPAILILRMLDNSLRVEKKLTTSDQRFYSILKNAPYMIYIKDLEGRYLQINPRFEHLLNSTSDEIEGKSDFDIFPRDLANRFRKNELQTLASNSVEEFEQEVDLGNGPHTYSSVKFPLKDPKGNAYAICAICTDITDRKRAQTELKKAHDTLESKVLERTRELRTSESYLRAVLNNIFDGLLTMDEEGKIRSCNPTAEKLFQRQEHEILGRIFFTFLPEPYRTRIKGYIQKSLFAGVQNMATIAQEVVGTRPDGSIFDLEIAISYMTDHNRDTIFIVLARDISDRKKKEAQIRQKTRELQTTNQELGEFAYIASHDLQEPLRKAILFGDRIKMTYPSQESPEGIDYVDRLQKSMSKMQRFINDLLRYSQVTRSSKLSEEVKLDEILADIISDLEDELQEFEGEIKVDPLPVIKGNKIQIDQLFHNLVSNSIKYRKENVPPRIKISPGNEDWYSWKIRVEDNGIGINPAYFDKIFKPFERLHSQDEYTGSGIGLAICSKVVNRHGGNIEVQSAPGQGATFVITLPKTPPVDQESRPEPDRTTENK